MVITPVDIEASAMLKMGRKNSKSSPPQKGNQDGKCPFITGKYNMSTTLPCKKEAYPV